MLASFYKRIFNALGTTAKTVVPTAVKYAVTTVSQIYNKELNLPSNVVKFTISLKNIEFLESIDYQPAIKASALIKSEINRKGYDLISFGQHVSIQDAYSLVRATFTIPSTALESYQDLDLQEAHLMIVQTLRTLQETYPKSTISAEVFDQFYNQVKYLVHEVGKYAGDFNDFG